MAASAIVPCPPVDPQDPCTSILKKIWEFIFSERPQPRSGQKGLFFQFDEQIHGQQAPGSSGWAGHDEAIRNNIAGLKKQMKKYKDQDCGDPPTWATEWANKPAPTPEEYVGPQPANPSKAPAPVDQPIMDNNTAKIVLGGAVGAYVIYRIIRFIPSLFPPLWPTIPANATIP